MGRFIRKVFLSYSFKDAETICLIRDSLKERGFEIVLDRNIEIGSNFGDDILSWIEECDCVVCIFSNQVSEMVLKEYEIASKSRKKIFVYIKEDKFVGSLREHFQNIIVGLWNDETELATKIIADISGYELLYPQRGYIFEHIVQELFESYGYKTILAKYDKRYDLIAQKNNRKFFVEVKIQRQKVINLSSLAGAIVASQLFDKSEDAMFVIIVANKLSKKLQEAIKQTANLIVLDIDNLLYLVKDNEILKSQLVSLLEFSVDEIEEKEPKEFLELLGTANYKIDEKEVFDVLIKEIRDWNPAIKTSYEYEDLCMRVLYNLFATDLALWRDQQRSNEDLFRFDLICKIKDDIKPAFWKFIEKYFQSKYIIFEFKNYSERITQKEIYTTEKYLYAKALRCVAIIISCNGENNNAKKAIKGILRENGKLILSITNMDMINMLEGKKRNISPAEYLYGMLDNMLVELDK